MPQREFVARNALLLCLFFFIIGALSLGMAHDHIPGLNYRWMAHVGSVLMLLSGVVLMWRAEHEGR